MKHMELPAPVASVWHGSIIGVGDTRLCLDITVVMRVIALEL